MVSGHWNRRRRRGQANAVAAQVPRAWSRIPSLACSRRKRSRRRSSSGRYRARRSRGRSSAGRLRGGALRAGRRGTAAAGQRAWAQREQAQARAGPEQGKLEEDGGGGQPTFQRAAAAAQQGKGGPRQRDRQRQPGKQLDLAPLHGSLPKRLKPSSVSSVRHSRPSTRNGAKRSS